ncbi:multidrug efflux RND transporter periplasmic adaptor MexH [Mucilaginibacter koreensis]
MKKTILTIVIVAAILAGIVVVLNKNKKKNESVTAEVAKGSGDAVVNVAQVKRTAVDLNFSVNGTLAADQSLDFMAENSGRITRLLVDVGSRVSRGQVIAVLDAELLRTDLEAAQATYQNAQRDAQRYQSSFTTGGVTQQQLDRANLDLRTAQTRLQSARRRISDASIKAPINGIINQRYIEQGAYVGPGTKLFEIVDASKLKLKVNVNESQVANLRMGQSAKILSGVFPDQQFSGTVSFIAAKGDNTLNFPVEVKLNSNPGNKLKAGMYATAVFEFAKEKPSITVPRGAFVGSVSSNEIYVLDNGNTARTRKVVSGRIIGDQVEILQGLQEGETVITSGQINLTDGAKVSIQK